MKRLPIKYIRDACKSRYNKASKCYICSSTDSLEFHHYYSMTALLDRWERKNGKLKTEADVLEMRDGFISMFSPEIYDKTVTLCSSCHSALHRIYGCKPSLGTATKQQRWVERKKNVV